MALAGNLFSLYVFYECLTMVTLPLVTHKKDVQSIRAGRKYLIFSISGAALAFIALIFIMHYGVSTDFVPVSYTHLAVRGRPASSRHPTGTKA